MTPAGKSTAKTLTAEESLSGILEGSQAGRRGKVKFPNTRRGDLQTVTLNSRASDRTLKEALRKLRKMESEIFGNC